MELGRNGISKWRRTPDGSWSRGVYRLVPVDGEVMVHVLVDGKLGEAVAKTKDLREGRQIVNQLLGGAA
jgi:hypothetical protein